MADTRTPAQRSHIMKSVGTKNTGPEMAVRRALHRLGLRYRLHARELPGRPDIVFRPRKVAIFVHGCFWHGHDCPKGRAPKSRLDYWAPKLTANAARDAANVRALEDAGWRVLIVWQCETADADRLATKLVDFLELDAKGIHAANPIG
jgi:DNA mismatch endonuclease (patch repair protein)